MDPLALLSNLHGDGPATLQRLRRHGCDTLTSLLTSEPDDLAPILGWEPVRTQRFLREADVLSRRLGDGLLDVEEDAPEPVAPEPKRGLHVLTDDEEDEKPAAELPDELVDRRRPTTLATGEVQEEVLEEESFGDEVEDAEVALAEETTEDAEEDVALSDEVRSEVLNRWRTLDATEPVQVDTLVPHTPDGPIEAPGRPLAAAGIDGLDPVRIRAIQSAGITTVEDLARADEMDLHRAGLPFTVAGRLIFLARRAAAKSSPQPARSRGPQGDAAGPFA